MSEETNKRETFQLSGQNKADLEEYRILGDRICNFYMGADPKKITPEVLDQI